MVNRDRTCVWRETLPLLHVSRDITKHYKCVHTLVHTAYVIYHPIAWASAQPPPTIFASGYHLLTAYQMVVGDRWAGNSGIGGLIIEVDLF